MHPTKDFFDSREQAVEPEPILRLLPAPPGARVITRADVTEAIAHEKAQAFQAIHLAILRAAKQYGPQLAQQMAKDALYLEFGQEAVTK